MLAFDLCVGSLLCGSVRIRIENNSATAHTRGATPCVAVVSVRVSGFVCCAQLTTVVRSGSLAGARDDSNLVDPASSHTLV